MTPLLYAVSDVVFLVFGLALVVFALWRQPEWAPVDIARKDFVFKVPSVAFLVLCGLLLMAVGTFFRYQRYDDRMEEYETKLNQSRTDAEQMKRAADDLRQDLLRFRAYEVVVQLQFPEPIDQQPVNVQGLVRKPGEPVPAVREALVIATRRNTMAVKMVSLNPGDRVSVAAFYANKRWISDDFEVPAATNLSMKREQ